MLRALTTASTGMQAQQKRLDVTANNIANVGTTGFKKSEVQFSDLLYQTEKAAGAATSQATSTPTATQVGLGVKVEGTARLETQGSLRVTQQELDMAIEGRGFFPVQTPSGELAFTRNGSFHRNADGQIVNPAGLLLAADIEIPRDAEKDSLSIGADGLVTCRVPTQVEPLELGKIRLATFSNPAGLEAMGHNLLKETVASGSAQLAAPGEDGTGNLQQGALEMSNVQVVEEMIDLITGQRAYEVNSRVVRAADEMLQQAAQLR